MPLPDDKPERHKLVVVADVDIPTHGDDGEGPDAFTPELVGWVTETAGLTVLASRWPDAAGAAEIAVLVEQHRGVALIVSEPDLMPAWQTRLRGAWIMLDDDRPGATVH